MNSTFSPCLRLISSNSPGLSGLAWKLYLARSWTGEVPCCTGGVGAIAGDKIRFLNCIPNVLIYSHVSRKWDCHCDIWELWRIVSCNGSEESHNLSNFRVSLVQNDRLIYPNFILCHPIIFKQAVIMQIFTIIMLNSSLGSNTKGGEGKGAPTTKIHIICWISVAYPITLKYSFRVNAVMQKNVHFSANLWLVVCWTLTFVEEYPTMLSSLPNEEHACMLMMYWNERYFRTQKKYETI